jgi:uncharacterized protein (TIGR01777 family)
MRVAVTGASGLIGTALLPALRSAGHDVTRLVRRAPRAADEVAWDPAAQTIDVAALAGVDAIVHLAGENLGRRWTSERRRRVLESRVTGTRLVAETVARLEPRPVLLAPSAVGFYGQRGDEELTERSPAGEGFLADVVQAWEAAADPAREAGARVVRFRQGMVLSRNGGALARMLRPYRLGIGGRVGSGRQWWSWVAMDDVVSAYLHALDRPLEGVYNLAAPAVTNADFVRALGAALHRPTVIPVPGFAIKLLWGEMGEEVLLGGQRVVPERLPEAGFTFAHPEILAALEHVLAAGRS